VSNTTSQTVRPLSYGTSNTRRIGKSRISALYQTSELLVSSGPRFETTLTGLDDVHAAKAYLAIAQGGGLGLTFLCGIVGLMGRFTGILTKGSLDLKGKG
jgi:hypothetical protein